MRTIAVLALALSGCVGGEISGEDDGTDRVENEIRNIPQFPHKRLCSMPGQTDWAACNAHVRVEPDGTVQPNATPQGLGPADLKSAYKLDTTLGAGATIAIVDAQDDPSAEADLATYRSTYGLPACTTANGCFKKVNQSGVQGSYPKADKGWSGEIALDLDAASAVCPNCKILLVEANTASMTDLGTAVNTAVSLGATVVSNSYGGGESSSDTSFDTTYFHHPGVAIFVSSGDNGYGAQYPAASQYVIAVGGTSLAKSSSATRGWVESAWSGAGSGCSAYDAKPTWQKDASCAKRTIADVSAVADPNTGLAVYDKYGSGGWIIVGGTSLASPVAAGIWALTGHGKDTASLAYANPTAFFDVTSGSNGSCGGTYLCTGKAGYDGPTGVGTPNGSVLAGGATPPPPPPPPTDGGTTPPPPDMSGPAGGGVDNGTCSHGLCSAGAKLTSGCSPCATQICNADSYCCRVKWDSICAGEVASICGASCQ
jgi:hypothetical protein